MHSEHSEHRKKAALFLGVVGHHHTVVIPADDWRAVVIQIKTIQKVLYPYIYIYILYIIGEKSQSFSEIFFKRQREALARAKTFFRIWSVGTLLILWTY